MSDGTRISIVDDDPSVARALTRLFRSAGYSVLAFDSAEAFLDADGPQQTDCLILDVHLPGLSGPELQTQLVDTERSVPTVFITAFDSERVREEALESGARAFLQKPVDSARLLEVIQDVLAGA